MLNTKRYLFFVISLGLLLPFRGWAAEDVCHPAAKPSMPQYVVGYGSLIQTDSKEHSYKGAGINIPVMVNGYQRGWFAQGTPIGFSTTFLGIAKNPQAQFNGVIFNVPASALPTYDKREMNYCRQEVLAQNIKMLNSQSLPKGQFWLYVPQDNSRAIPSVKFPLVQSYVDIFLSGCLEMQEKYQLKNYANQCIEMTNDWSPYWVNDRIHPRRPWVGQPDALKIDKLLNEKLPQLFQQIKIE